MPNMETIGGENGVDLPSGAPWTNISGSPFSMSPSALVSFTIPETGILAISCNTTNRTHIRISKDGVEATISDLYITPINTWLRMPVEKGWVVSLRNDTTIGTSVTRAVLLKNVGE